MITSQLGRCVSLKGTFDFKNFAWRFSLCQKDAICFKGWEKTRSGLFSKSASLPLWRNFFFIRFVLEKRMREPALILNGIIIQRRVQNTEAGFQIKQAPGQLVNFRYKFINFLSLSPLEPPPPKKNIKHKKQWLR